MKFDLGGFHFQIDRSATPPPTDSPVPIAPPRQTDLLAGIDEGLLALDHRQRIVFCSNAMRPLLNRPPSESVGRPLWEVLRHRPVQQIVEQSLKTGETARTDLAPTGADGSLWSVIARPSPVSGAAGVLLLFKDVTEIRRLERLRKEFVANVSHELKTPLTALKAALETLLDGAWEDRRVAREFLQTAQSNVERLHRLIDDLLLISRLERPDSARTAPGKCSLSEAMRKAAASVLPLADKKRIHLETVVPDGPAEAALSEDELIQVFVNLLDNAVKFTPSGGTVSFSARLNASAAEVRVKDTGIGIPAEDLPRIFERFYRVDKSRSPERGGTGLGLAIVKHILENRNGAVRVESSAGRGSEFTVTFPTL
ncbi:MAG TPA: ATP-binding protein [Elusimicrobiota bacterium]|nr:ATP-binding protein [Elusimicrobiota bacterium]